MSAGGKVLAAGVIGIVGLIALAAVAVAAESGPRRLPAPKLPRPVRRVHEWRRSIVDESGTAYIARIYAPTESIADAPWVVTALHDPARDTEIIRIALAPTIPTEDLDFAVRWGEEFNPNRQLFRGRSHELWPDDKWNDRVIFRYTGRPMTGCFLVEVTLDDESVDFYHESERPERPHASQALAADAASVPDPGAKTRDDYRTYQRELEEIRLQRVELEASTLHEDDKEALRGFLDQRKRNASSTHLGKLDSVDYFSVHK